MWDQVIGVLSAEPQYTVASWDVLGGDAQRKSSIYKATHKAGALSGARPFHKHLHINVASPNISSKMDTEPV